MMNRKLNVLIAVLMCATLPVSAPAQNEEDLLWLKKGHDGTINSIVFSPDGQFFATASDDFPSPARTIRLWRSSDAELIRTLPLGAGGTTMDISPDGALLAIGSPANRSILLWSIKGDSLWKQIVIAETDFTDIVVRFTQDGHYIAAHAIGGLLGLWDIQTEERKQVFEQAQTQPQSLDLSPDGRYIASANMSGHILVWQRATGKVQEELWTDGIWSLKFSPDGRYLAACGGGKDGAYPVTIWRTDDWKPAHVLWGHTRTIRNLCFSPKNAFIVSVADDGMIKIWDIESGEEIYHYVRLHPETHSPVPQNTVAISPDSSCIITTGGTGIYKWQAHWTKTTDVPEGQPQEISMHITPNPASAYATLQFMATTTAPVSISIWDTQGRKSRTITEDKLQQAGMQSFPLNLAWRWHCHLTTRYNK